MMWLIFTLFETPRKLVKGVTDVTLSTISNYIVEFVNYLALLT